MQDFHPVLEKMFVF